MPCTLLRSKVCGLRSMYIATATSCTAFEELRRVAPRLEAYHSSLFGRKALSFDRGALNRAANEALDHQLHGCLAAIADAFLHPATFTLLELLVRVYKYDTHHPH